MIIGLLVANSTNLAAQTKKIAWRSHGGSDITFTFDLPDEFGLTEPMIYRKTNRKIQRDSITTTPDSLAVCKPLTPTTPVVLEPVATPKEKEQERRQRRKAKRQEVRQEIKTLKKELREELKADVSAANTTAMTTAAILPTPKGATQWLWLLLLPLAAVFAVSLQKP